MIQDSDKLGVNIVVRSAATGLGVVMPRQSALKLLDDYANNRLPDPLVSDGLDLCHPSTPFVVKTSEIVLMHAFDPIAVMQAQMAEQQSKQAIAQALQEQARQRGPQGGAGAVQRVPSRTFNPLAS